MSTRSSRRAVTRSVGRASELPVDGPAAAPTTPPELWCRLAILILVCLAGLFGYLGARPGGRGPIFAYHFGRDILFVLAFLLLLFGVFRSWRRPPFLRPGRTRAFLALALVIGVAPYRLPYPSSRDDRPSRTRFELPVRGTWRTYWGGDDKDSNRLVGFFADRRYGLHLVREVDGSRVRPDLPAGLPAGRPTRPEDYWSHGETIFAPAPGRVVQVRDGLPDAPLGAYAAGPPGGNLVVLEIAPGEFLFLPHLLAGSMRVAVGQDVESGQPLARLGASGFSPVTPEPHLALHLQTTPVEGWGEGIPWRFHGYAAEGEPVASGVPRGGVDAGRGLVGELLEIPAPPPPN